MAKPLVRRSVVTYYITSSKLGRLYLYFQSTQIEDIVDGLIDSLIDAVHFDDLVLEKDVADDIDQIEVLFCNYYAKQAWENVSKSGQSFKNDVK